MADSPFHIGDVVVLGKRKRVPSPEMTVLGCWQPDLSAEQHRHRVDSYWLVELAWFDGTRLQQTILPADVLAYAPAST